MKTRLGLAVASIKAIKGLDATSGGGGGYPISLAADILTTPAANGWEAGWFGTSQDPSTYSNSGMTYTQGSGWNGSDGFTTPIVGPTAWHPSYNSVKPAALKYVAQYAGTVDVKIKNVQALSSTVLFALWKNGTQVGTNQVPPAGPADITWSGVTLSVSDVLIIELNPSNGSAGNDSVQSTDVTIG